MSQATHEPSQRWQPRWGAAFSIRALAFVIPLVSGYFAGAFVADRLEQPRTVSGVVFWWLLVISVASLAAHVVDRYTRLLIPLSGLLRMTMAFPDKAPSRFRIAQRASNFTVLRQRIEDAAARGDHDVASASELVLSLAAALSHHDRKTRGHSERTRAYTDLLSEELRLPEPDRDKLRWAALLHDVGKLEVPAEILNKDAGLSDEEWEIIRRHPITGMRLIAPIASWLGPWAPTIEHHHERWDGSGYPYGLTGENISFGARIVAVADAYDVITAGRSYQPSRAHSEARKEVARHAGTQFDPKVVRALMNVALGRLRWSTGPLAAIADFPFFRPLESMGRDLVTMVTAGAVTASAAMAGVLPVPDISSVDPDRAAAVVVASLGLEPIGDSGSPQIVLAGPESSTTSPTSALDDTTSTAESTTDTSAATATSGASPTAPLSTSSPPTTQAPSTTPTGPTTSTTAPTTTSSTTTTAPPPTTTTAPTGPTANSDSASGFPKVVIHVLDNDTYGANPVITIASGPSRGKAEIEGTAILYNALGFQGIATLSYRLCDASGVCSTANVTVNTNP
ncbi:MAG TPA: HD-GYP domain-containing protein [Acidimicrobiia bacterium]|nr:HD-GYP domain-containing protein [Acidimicrobiia bacterium]